MTTPKVRTISRGGSRYYVHPDTGNKVPGVTSVVGMLPKGFLQHWAAKVVAETAVDSLGEVVNIAMRGDRQGAVDYLKRSPRRSTQQSAEIGSEAHDIFERKAKGEAVGRLHPDLQVFADHFDEFLEIFQPEFKHLEATVWSEEHDYAGSFDVAAVLNGPAEGAFLLGDWKTTRSGVHEEVALQLSAYRYADHLVSPSGETQPMPEVTGGFVLHIRPEGWKLVPVRCDRAVFEYFLNLRQVFDWDSSVKSDVIGEPVASGPNEDTPKAKPARRTSPRKAAKK